ncbi:hypothetical protein H6F42_08780 [Pseudanabaena sp. FACHB-1998]|uniref:hypothetical protein n=1 Tax=Pseudanabaena sp. FACHB-1998 TaxID=2692858 RepID=UPI001680351F|nr:hypothetical protein [Pseudanabaena sp. FACHB-1998]MBD2177002.1 hypothetical protein [Pseudanabaena sp. FACHB-1998]
MSKKKEINFPIRLSKEEWESSTLSWRCRALEIPGADIKTVMLNGIDQHKNHYRITDIGNISINIPNYPVYPETDDVVVIIQLTKQLSTQNEVSIWQIISAISAIVATFFSPIGAEIYKQTQNHKDYQPSVSPPSTSTTTPSPTSTTTPSPTSTTTPSPTSTTTPSPTSTTQDGLLKYPLADCGAGATYIGQNAPHRVFVPSNGNNLKTVRDKFCKDAFLSDKETKIVMASFTKKEDADIFLKDIKRFFPDADTDSVFR